MTASFQARPRALVGAGVLVAFACIAILAVSLVTEQDHETVALSQESAESIIGERTPMLEQTTPGMDSDDALVDQVLESDATYNNLGSVRVPRRSKGSLSGFFPDDMGQNLVDVDSPATKPAEPQTKAAAKTPAHTVSKLQPMLAYHPDDISEIDKADKMIHEHGILVKEAKDTVEAMKKSLHDAKEHLKHYDSETDSEAAYNDKMNGFDNKINAKTAKLKEVNEKIKKKQNPKGSVHGAVESAANAATDAATTIKKELGELRDARAEKKKEDKDVEDEIEKHKKALSNLKDLVDQMASDVDDHSTGVSSGRPSGSHRHRRSSRDRDHRRYRRHRHHGSYGDENHLYDQEVGYGDEGYHDYDDVSDVQQDRRLAQGENTPRISEADRRAHEQIMDARADLQDAVEDVHRSKERLASTKRRAKEGREKRAAAARAAAARKWSYAVNIGGDPILKPPNSDQTMHEINKAMAVVDMTAPPTSEYTTQQIRHRIEAEVRDKVQEDAMYLEKEQSRSGFSMDQKDEEAWIQKSIKAAIVRAVARSVMRNSKELNLKQSRNPNYGHKYVADEAVKAANEASAKALAVGKGNDEVRRDAVDAAQRAADIATRTVAKRAARSAALVSAEMASHAGRDQVEQGVASKIASSIATRQVVHDPEAMNYLNGLSSMPVSSAANIADVDGHVVKELDEADDIPDQTYQLASSNGYSGESSVLAAQVPPKLASHHTTALQNQILMSDEPLSNDGVTPKGAQGKLADSTHKTDSTNAKTKVLAKTKTTDNQDSPKDQRLILEAAMIRAQSAAKRIKAAATAASMAPPGPEGAKIIAQAKLMSAQAAKDVADARMKIMLVKEGIGTKPIIHEAASQAVDIVTPIATEVATQSASLKASQMAMDAVKLYMQQYKEDRHHAQGAAAKVVRKADKGLLHKIQAASQQRVSKVVQAAIDEAVKKGSTKEQVVKAAKEAAMQELKHLSSDKLEVAVQNAADAAAKAAASAAQASGGSPDDVARAKEDARNTVRLDGKADIQNDERDAKRDAESAAVKAVTASEAHKSQKLMAEKSVAQNQVDRAIDGLIKGHGAAAAHDMAQAENALNSRDRPAKSKKEVLATAEEEEEPTHSARIVPSTAKDRNKYEVQVPEDMMLLEQQEPVDGQLPLAEILGWDPLKEP